MHSIWNYGKTCVLWLLIVKYAIYRGLQTHYIKSELDWKILQTCFMYTYWTRPMSVRKWHVRIKKWHFSIKECRQTSKNIKSDNKDFSLHANKCFLPCFFADQALVLQNRISATKICVYHKQNVLLLMLYKRE